MLIEVAGRSERNEREACAGSGQDLRHPLESGRLNFLPLDLVIVAGRFLPERRGVDAEPPNARVVPGRSRCLRATPPIGELSSPLPVALLIEFGVRVERRAD